MEPEFWHERWRRGDIGWHLPHPNPHLERYWPRIPVDAGGRVFVPLCGKSRDLAWLAGRGHPVVGVELSPLAVEQFFAEQGLHPRWETLDHFRRCRAGDIDILCGDYFALKAAQLGPVAAVWDRAALIAMPPAVRPRYVDRLLHLIGPGTPILLATMEYPQVEMPGPPFSVPEDEVRALYARTHTVERLHTEDILDQQPRFRQRGLSRLVEKVFRLLPSAPTDE